MIIRALIISTTLILSGCLSNHIFVSDSIVHHNIYRISRLQVGMTQEEVYQIMHYPSREDRIETPEGCYNIWFYITKANVLDQNQEVARNLTPLIFKEGVFVGMGRAYYNLLVQRSNQPQITPAPQPVNQEEENIEIEKTLTPSPSSPKAQPLKSPAQVAPPAEKKTPPPKTAPVAKPKGSTPMQTTPAKPAQKSTQPLSMCSKLKRVELGTEPGTEKPLDEDSSRTKSSEPQLDEEDREMLDQEREENFNDW
jgi:outer membrane protein assembly factor BamE (lipoprotein component of BamABCDE complex)